MHRIFGLTHIAHSTRLWDMKKVADNQSVVSHLQCA